MNHRVALIFTLVIISTTNVLSQARHVSLTLRTSGAPGPTPNYATNELDLFEFETAELVSHTSIMTISDSDYSIAVIKDGVESLQRPFPAYAQSSTAPLEFRRLVVAGPAKLQLRGRLGQSQNYFATFRITPEAFPPDRTLITMPGTNKTAITLECSTNLIQWIPSTNGVYGPLPEAKFFRIQARVIE